MTELLIYLSAGGQAASHEDVSPSIFSRNGHGEPNQCLGFRLAGYSCSDDTSLLNNQLGPGFVFGASHSIH